MCTNLKPVVGAYLTLGTLYFLGVVFAFGPILARDAPGDPPVPRLLGFLVSIAVYVTLYVWIEREIGKPFKAAMVAALSQLALVDVDYVLSGDRGVAAAGASAVLLVGSWSAMAWVYRWLGGGQHVERSESARPQDA